MSERINVDIDKVVLCTRKRLGGKAPGWSKFMNASSPHTFHIPVMGTGFTIDTPLKVARFGISSVVSIIDDGLVEQLRRHHSFQNLEPYLPIKADEPDYRARRVTAYLNLLDKLVTKQVAALRELPFEEKNDLSMYFELLPSSSVIQDYYFDMLQTEDAALKRCMQSLLREQVIAGAIDVNIMSKVDKINYAKNGDATDYMFNDAAAALRGFAKSNLQSSVVLSAGYNPKLYAYLEQFDDFFPDANGLVKKKIILKVSDFRSAAVQGKLMAKKGIWVSEFRVESGLNCGGHAFATEGLLLGPILEEFSKSKNALVEELFVLCNAALKQKDKTQFVDQPDVKLSVQGGVGTNAEHEFLRKRYKVDTVGWGSPFLLVPEATGVDNDTLEKLATAKPDDYYMSDASPLGVPFNNFKPSSANRLRKRRIEADKPGSPCYQKYLVNNTEFTDKPICTASRKYQFLKLKSLRSQNLSQPEFEKQAKAVTDKECICMGLGVSVLNKYELPTLQESRAVSICPGPNLAFFSGVFSLREMVDHIYGRTNLLNTEQRSHMFVNELKLYVEYLNKEVTKATDVANVKQTRYLQSFRENLVGGVAYYKTMLTDFKRDSEATLEKMKRELEANVEKLNAILIGNAVATV